MNKLRKIIQNSCFYRNYYEISMPVDDIINQLTRFSLGLHDKGASRKNHIDYTSDEMLKKIIPDFQRDNDKWTQEMQIKFVENILCGAASVLVMGYVTIPGEEGCKTNCRLIDGQQRLTAIIAWMNGEFKAFGEFEFTHEDVNTILNGNFGLHLRIYEFNTESEMVQFYIDINENITHSSDDILKAKIYLKGLK